MISRYNAAAISRKSSMLKVLLPASCATLTRSDKPMIDTSAVALSNTSQLLPRLGKAKRIICGNTTKRNRCQRLRPKQAAASC
ncbi:hypothetical protein D3C75_1258870 [compost metagenome]